MGSSPRWTAAVGVLVLLSVAAASAQHAPEVVRIAALSSGSIGGVVQDELGTPISGALVSAVGASTSAAYTDRSGHFELRTLSPGPYLIRAHLSGFVAPRGQIVEVRASSRSASAIELRHVALSDARSSASSAPLTSPGLPASPVPAKPATIPVLTASMAISDIQATPDKSTAPADPSVKPDPATTEENTTDDHGEVAWRLRYARRSVLKEATLAGQELAHDAPPDTVSGTPGAPGSMFGGESRFDSAMRFGSSLFANVPLTGQFNLLTSSSFDSPEQLFSGDTFARSTAYMSLVAPAPGNADWSMRGALTQGDISSWFVSAAYASRMPSATHQYDLGFSYSMQRFDNGSPAVLRAMTDTNRNVGLVYADDTLTLMPNMSLSYGARYARYDYLTGHGLLSPMVGVTLVAADGLRVIAHVSSQSLAPGAEEFLPPAEGGLWLPPQRTFSTVSSDAMLQPERTTHLSVEGQHDLDAQGASTVSFRVFRQTVSNQMVTMFGLNAPDAPGTIGHYLVGDAGNVDAIGWSAGFRSTAFSRVRGSVEYRMTQGNWTAGGDAAYLLLVAPLVVRPPADRVQDLQTSIETDVPETSTRVLVVCRLSNLHATGGTDRPAYDSRFDVQIRQSLPFMDFSNAKWEMLVAVRNFFRDSSSPDSSVYDELLVVRPPKRIVGGLTLRF